MIKSMFYYRKSQKVVFTPDIAKVAISLKSDLSKAEEKQLKELLSANELEAIKAKGPFKDTDVRILRLPDSLKKKDRRKLVNRLLKHPLVKKAGSIVHLSDKSVSFLTDELIVKFKKAIDAGKLEALANAANLKILRKLPYAQNAYVLQANAVTDYDIITAINKLALKETVEYAEPNLVTTVQNDFTPNDFLFDDQPHHQVIGTEEAWDITRGDKDIIIAVVDSGCDIDHPDFTNPPTSTWGKIYAPFDFANMDANPTNMGVNGEHGTKSCGIAAANADNTEGIAGVAPSCRLMPIRRPSNGTDTDYADMYVWISGFNPESLTPDFPDPISPGADVISNSIGVQQAALSGTMQDALDFITENGRNGRGCVVVYSVGNDSDDFTVLHNPGGANEHGGRQWAAYNRTIAVASSAISPPDAAEVKVVSSSFGSALDVCAPGGGPRGAETRTMSTDNVGGGHTAGSDTAATNDYSDFGQTSCACPQVSGVAALMLSINPGLTWREVKQFIRETAERIDIGNTDPIGQWIDTDGDGEVDFSQWYGCGRVNAARAVRRARDERPLIPSVILDIEAIVAAQEVVYMRRLFEFTKKFTDECPTPPPPPFDRLALSIKLMQQEIGHVEELEKLRAQYLSAMQVDKNSLKAIARICRESADRIEAMDKPA
jgi:subtilisin family serine protease